MGERVWQIRRTRGEKVFDFFNVLFLLLFTFTCVYPFYYIFIYSISDPLQATRGILFWPVDVTLENYIRVFKLKGIGLATMVSVSITVISTVFAMFVNGMAGYLLSRPTMPFRRIIYRTFVVTMYVSGGLIPSFLLMKYLHLYNTYWIYIYPSVGAYYMILIKTYIESIPASLEESAKLDGASYWTIMIRIILPLSIPILATIGVFNAVGRWSDYSTTLIYTTDKNLRTLQYILYQYLKSASTILLENGADATNMQRKLTPTSIKMTLVVITVIPILYVYPYLQRYFVKGIMLGAVKG